MSTQLQLRRGTTTQHATFTGAEGEVTVDTTKDTLVLHDGLLAGGHPIATESYVQGELTDKADRDVTSGAVFLGSGTTAQRPVLLSTARAMWYNTDLLKFEGWNGTQWVGVGGGATGGGADTVFVETSYTVTQNYTLTAGKSAMTVGDYLGNVTIAEGVDITIPDTSVWVILGA